MKVKYQNREVEAIPVEIIHQEELWNTYQLADGSQVRAKLVMSDIVRIEGELSQGKPIYITRSTKLLVVD